MENTFTFGDNFAYQFDEDPDYMVDVLSVDEGILYFTCQNDIGRSVYYDEGSYRVICTSSIFGAMADADGTNTKADLMARYFLIFPMILIRISGLRPMNWILEFNT